MAVSRRRLGTKATDLVKTKRILALIEVEKEKIENVVSGLEKAWKIKFKKSSPYPDTVIYEGSYRHIVCRIGGEVENLNVNVVLLNNKTNTVLYSGALQEDPNYYVRLVKSRVGVFKKQTITGADEYFLREGKYEVF